MTVADLRRLLEPLPADTAVAACNWDSYWSEFDHCLLEPSHLRLPTDIEYAVDTDDSSIRSDRVLVLALGGSAPGGWPRL